MKNFFENTAGYIVLALLIVGQCVIRSSYIGGQFVYFAANILSVTRAFTLDRPRADKVKDICCTAITTGLILLFFI